MNSLDVRVFAIRRRPGRKAFEMRWRVAGRDRARSFMTRALADSYRAELVRAARKGLEFDPATGEPARWKTPELVAVTWYQHAVAYAEMKWPHLAPHSRASLADALATVTPLLTRDTGHRPSARKLRAALYGYAFSPQRRRFRPPDPATGRALAWLERASLPVGQLSNPRIIRAALDGLCLRLDGSPAAANTITRKGAVFHCALGYAVELGLLPANPISQVHWRAPRATVAVNPVTVASPAQVRAVLAQVARIRPELAAFFGCLYYAALRPEEAVALRQEDLILPAHDRGKMIITAACPRTGTAWTSTGTRHEPRGLKHRPDGTIRVVPIPAVLVRMLRCHLRQFGTTPDGRLFRGGRGGVLSESVYGASPPLLRPRDRPGTLGRVRGDGRPGADHAGRQRVPARPRRLSQGHRHRGTGAGPGHRAAQHRLLSPRRPGPGSRIIRYRGRNPIPGRAVLPGHREPQAAADRAHDHRRARRNGTSPRQARARAGTPQRTRSRRWVQAIRSAACMPSRATPKPASAQASRTWPPPRQRASANGLLPPDRRPALPCMPASSRCWPPPTPPAPTSPKRSTSISPRRGHSTGRGPNCSTENGCAADANDFTRASTCAPPWTCSSGSAHTPGPDRPAPSCEPAARQHARASQASPSSSPRKNSRSPRFIAAGASTRQAASQMFLSPRTIDAHLRSIYAKLGITSRTELRAADLDQKTQDAAQ